MNYYYQLRKPREFRHDIMSIARECFLAQEKQEQIDKIRQAKKVILDDLLTAIKEIEISTTLLENALADEELKKEILNEDTNITREIPTFQTKKEKRTLNTINNTDDLKQFEYTLEQIEKRLSELRTT